MLVLDTKQRIHRIQVFKLHVNLLESLNYKFVSDAQEHATQEKWAAYCDKFEPELDKLRSEIGDQRRRLLSSGIQVPDDWLTFPVKLAYKIDTESDGLPVVTEDTDIKKRWEDVCESLDVRIDRLEYEPAAPAKTAALTDEAVSILKYLDKEHPDLCSVDALENGIPMSRNTVIKYLRRLITDGLAARPEGVKKGATITEAGRAELAKR